jgi:hypothetical protein
MSRFERFLFHTFLVAAVLVLAMYIVSLLTAAFPHL